MSYLLAQILVCLLIAGLIGGLIGWLLRGGCKNKLRDNDEYWERKMKSSTSDWETKVQNLMLEKEKYTKSSEAKLLAGEQKVSFFEKQNKELTLKNGNLLLNEQKLKNKVKEELSRQKLAWETKVNTLWSSKENLKSKALTLMNNYESLKSKFLENEKLLEEKSQVYEKLQDDFTSFEIKAKEDKAELDKSWNTKFKILEKEQLEKNYHEVEELKNKIAFLEAQNIELDKKLTLEKLALEEREDTLLSELNSLKDEKKD